MKKLTAKAGLAVVGCAAMTASMALSAGAATPVVASSSASDVDVAGKKTLDVKPQQQIGRNWCWATTGLTIIQYLGHGLDKKQNDYCNAGFGLRGGGQCPDKTGTMQNVQAGARAFGAGTGRAVKTLSFQQVKAQIDGDSPIPAGYFWTQGGGHMVGIAGYDDGSQDLFVNNSLSNAPRQSWINHGHFTRNSQYKWAESITGMTGDKQREPEPEPAPTRPAPTRPAPTTTSTPPPAPNPGNPGKGPFDGEKFVYVTDTNLARVKEESKYRPVVFMASAEWCYACSTLKPKMDQLSNELGDKFLFAYVDSDRARTAIRGLSAGPITGYPTLVGWVNGAEDTNHLRGDQGVDATRTFIQGLVGKANPAPAPTTTPPPAPTTTNTPTPEPTPEPEPTRRESKIDVTSSNVDEVIAESKNRPVVFMLSTQSCGFCRTLKPRLDKLATEYDGKFLFGYTDVTRDRGLVQKVTSGSVRGFPTTVAWKDGREFDTMVGDQEDAGTRQFIQKVVGQAVAEAEAEYAGEMGTTSADVKGEADTERVASFFASLQAVDGDMSMASKDVTAQDMGVQVNADSVPVHMLSADFVKGASENPAEYYGEARLATAGDQKAVMIYAGGEQHFGEAHSGDDEYRYGQMADGGVVFLEPQRHAFYRLMDGQVQPLNDSARELVGDGVSVADYQEMVTAKYGDKLEGSEYQKNMTYGGF